MYYIAFFIDYRSLLIETLNSFVKDDPSNVWIYNYQKESQLQSLENLPTHSGYWYSQPWYIYGSSLTKIEAQNFPSIPVYTGHEHKTSFKEIDEVLNWLSINYAWSIFPWGGPKRFLSFGFLSKERRIFNEFVKALSSSLDKICTFNNVHIRSPLISSYEITRSFSQLVKAILFSGYQKPAMRLWNICRCDMTPPWLITDLIFDEETFSTFSWDEAQYKFIQSLNFAIRSDRALKVYQPLDKKSFESMCMLSTQEPDTLILVPQDTDLKFLQNILIETENYNSYSDLMYLQDILSATKWFYGFDRDRVDYGNSLFVAQDSNLLLKFDELTLNDDYQLISCF